MAQGAAARSGWCSTRPSPIAPATNIWKRDFKGSSGLFSFELKGADDAARARSSTPRAVRDRLQLGRLRKPGAAGRSRSAPSPKPPAPNLVRLHIGLEDPDDLIADLSQAFDWIARD